MGVSHLLRGVRELIYPRICPICRQRELQQGSLCQRCADALPSVTAPWCQACGGNLDTVLDLCQECLQQDRPWQDGLTLYDYGGIVRQVIHRFKYQGDVALAPWLGRQAWEAWQQRRSTTVPDWVVPVPLHWFKAWRRGYNQTELLADAFAHHAGLPVVNCLERPRWTRSQASLNLRERRRNLQGAFRHRLDFEFTGKRVLLFDDVLTTGSTLAACTRQLQQAGVETVQVITIARG